MIVLMLVASAFMMTGCGGSSDTSEIAGTWRLQRYHINNVNQSTFFSEITIDNDGNFTARDGAITHTGEVTLNNRNRIRFSGGHTAANSFFRLYTYRVTVDGNHMVWEWSSMGSTAEFIWNRV